jgi:hypothetical protein
MTSIAKRLGMARRTVKAHFHQLFLRYGIHDGHKRVKLAVLLYRERRTENDGILPAAATLPAADKMPSKLRSTF